MCCKRTRRYIGRIDAQVCKFIRLDDAEGVF